MTEQKQVKSLTPFECVRNEINQRTERMLELNKDKGFIDRLKNVTFMTLGKSSKLLGLNRASLMTAMYECAKDGLLPDNIDAALIPYGGIVQYRRMVGGIRKMIQRGGKVASLFQNVVYEKDDWEFWYDEMGHHFKHKPAFDKDRGKVILTYSIAVLNNGERTVEVVPEKEMVKIRSKATSQNVWNEWEDEMRKKSALRRHSKNLPMSDEVREVVNKDDNDMYDLDAPTEAPAKFLPIESDIQGKIEAEARGEIAEPVKVEAKPAPTPVPKPAPKRKPKPRAKPAPAPAPAPQAPVSQRTKSLF